MNKIKKNQIELNATIEQLTALRRKRARLTDKINVLEHSKAFLILRKNKLKRQKAIE